MAPIEAGEGGFASWVRRWQAFDSTLDYVSILDELTREMASQRGVRWPSPKKLGFFEPELLDDLAELLEEPHALGWFHQHWVARDRQESFAEHHHREAKHADQIRSTQLYTPRWIADFLARSTLEGLDTSALPTICDPAVGGGQMLLAALGALREVRPEAPLEALIEGLYGGDLDPRAVEVARRGLKLEVARLLGKRCPRCEAAIDARIQVADGLDGGDGLYDIVLTNPPYMGLRSMPMALKERLRRDYVPYQKDLYAAFILRAHRLARHRIGILAQQTLWYLSSFTEARRDLLRRGPLLTFMHLGPHAFESLSGEKANVVAFVQEVQGGRGPTTTNFIDLRDLRSGQDKRDAFVRLEGDRSEEAQSRLRRIDVEALAVIPRQPLAHWLPGPLRRWFGEDRCLGDVAEVPGRQNKTGDNRRFVKAFTDVEARQIRRVEALWAEGSDDGRWVFYSKGGRYAPWWGGWSQVVDWSDEARRFYETNATSNLLPEAYWFREGLCYTDFGGAHFNARWMPPGCLFDMAGPAIFPIPCDGDPSTRLFALLALLNSTAARALLNALNPTLHYQVRDVRLLPLPNWDVATEIRLATQARALVDDLRLLSRLLPGDPLHTGQNSPEVRDLARAAFTTFASRQHALDRMVCELYGVPDLAAGPQPLHGSLIALEKSGVFAGLPVGMQEVGMQAGFEGGKSASALEEKGE